MLLKDRLDVPHRIVPALLRQDSSGFAHLHRADSLLPAYLWNKSSMLHSDLLFEELSINLVQLVCFLSASASLDIEAALEVIQPFLIILFLPLCLFPRDWLLAFIGFQLRKDSLG